MQRPPFRKPPDLPGTIVLREALRTIRHVAREGRDTVADAAGQAGPPVSQMAGFAIHGVDRVAEMAEGLAHQLIGQGPLEDMSLDRLDPGEANARHFAAAAYSGLREILRALGVRNALVSEMRLRAAFASVEDPDTLARGAQLCLAMEREGVVADVEMERTGDIVADEVPRLAGFSLMLWMLSDRSFGDARAALDAAVMLTIALRGDLAAAGDDDPAAIADLLGEFRHHV